MGVSSLYWYDIVRKLYDVVGNNEFIWNDVSDHITKQDFLRLKSSSIFIKTRRTHNGANFWRLNPVAIKNICLKC
jgi:hypothetical protein